MIVYAVDEGKKEQRSKVESGEASTILLCRPSTEWRMVALKIWRLPDPGSGAL